MPKKAAKTEATTEAKPNPQRCMTSLPPEMAATIPEVQKATGEMSVSEILKQGYVKVLLEIRRTGRLVIEAIPEVEAKQLA